MPKVHNYKTAVKLINKYRSFTLKDIEDAWRYNGGSTARGLTGFSHTERCTLCKSVDGICSRCIYNDEETCGCLNGENTKTYEGIDNAATPRALLNAFRRRAHHIVKLLNSKRKIQIS